MSIKNIDDTLVSASDGMVIVVVNLNKDEHEFKAVDGRSIADHTQRDKLLAECVTPASITHCKGTQTMLIKNTDDTLVNGMSGWCMSYWMERMLI